MICPPSTNCGGASAAATVLMMLVPILVFVITQSNIIETMGTSGMKD